MVAIVVAAFAMWGFAELADEVREGETHAFDRFLYTLLQGEEGDLLASDRFAEVMRDVTALGSYSLLGLFAGLTGIYLFLTGKTHAAVFLLAAILGGVLLSHGLKLVFDRSRPDAAAHQAMVFTTSFPSAHSTMSAVVYLTLASLLARLHASWRDKIFLIGAGIMLTVLVGASRVFLGVHWPTDVLAGWAVGSAWAFGCWAMFLLLQRRGAVEPADP